MRIKNWKKFQHFKDRRPPWIKLHREILEHRDIHIISDNSFRVLVGLWLLASEDETLQGILPSIEDITFRLRINKPKLEKVLHELDGFLVHDDITAISSRYQDGPPETEAETEKENIYKKENLTPTPAGNKPEYLEEITEYAKQVGKTAWDDAESVKLLNTYSPPGGDGIWRDKHGREVTDWRRCVVAWTVYGDPPHEPGTSPETEETDPDDPIIAKMRQHWIDTGVLNPDGTLNPDHPDYEKHRAQQEGVQHES